MRLIALLVTVTLVILTAPLIAEAQQAKNVSRIGFLIHNSRSSEATGIEAFHRGLQELGYVEGQNIVIEYRYADGEVDQLPQLAAELVRLNVAVIVTTGNSPTRAAQQATKTIPIVMTVVGDPIKAGFVASLAKPGGNITGLLQIPRQLNGKRLELLKEAFPEIARVAVFVYGGLTAQELSESLQETQLASQALGITLQLLDVRGPSDLDGAFSTATSQRPDALLILGSPVVTLHRKRVVDLAAQSRLPALYFSRALVDAGGLMSYGPNFRDNFRLAATYVHKILKGTKPADLPVQQPMKFELIINLKTAKALGLTIPPTFLFLADEVIR